MPKSTKLAYMVRSMNEPLKAGVVGVGHIGKNHARIYSEITNCSLAAILDTRRPVAESITKKHGGVAVSSLAELIDLVDVVSLATPTTTHWELARELISHGKHVLVEKPITETTAQAEELAELAAQENVILQVGHVERFNPVLDELEKRLGNPRFIEAHRLSPYPDRSTDIGVVLDLMIHDLEIILHLVRSEVSHLDVVGIPVLSSSEDIANARIRFASGCVANITASRISPEKMRKIRVFQDEAYLSLDYGNQSGEIYRRENGRISRDKVAVEKGEPLKRQLEAFVCCARDGSKPMVSGYEATAALDLALQITAKIKDQAVE